MSRDLSVDERPPSAWSSLEWLRGLIWPDASSVGLTGPGGPAHGERAWWILPASNSPRLLVPASRAAAPPSLRQFNDSMPQLARLRKAAVGEALRFGGGRLGRLRRLVVRDDQAGALIGSFLPGVFAVPSVEVAISIGRELRPNLKPVLQVMAPDGRVLGYAKLGWNDITRGLIDDEVRSLAAWGASPPRSFRVPAVVHDGTWERVRVLVVSPVPHPVFRRAPRDTMPPAAVLAEVAALHGLRTDTLASSAYFARLGDRLDELGAAGMTSSPVLTALEAMRGGAARAKLVLGTWHGDWAPWNMATAKRTLHVWDWERSSEDVPVGLDAVHFAFEVGYHKASAPVAAALAAGVERCRAILAELGIEADLDLLRTVYVLERLARLDEGHAVGVPTDDRLRDGLVASLEARG